MIVHYHHKTPRERRIAAAASRERAYTEALHERAMRTRHATEAPMDEALVQRFKDLIHTALYSA